MVQRRKLFMSGFQSTSGTLIALLLLFYLRLGLICKKVYRFVKYILQKSFNTFVQSAVKTRRQEDENPNSIIVAQTKKLPANNS